MIKPAGYRVLVKVDPVEDVSKGGIILAFDEKLEKANQNKGTLVAVGPIAWQAFGHMHTGKPWAKVGDRIIFSKYAGKTVVDPETEEEYRLMQDEDIAATFTETKKEKE